MDREISLERDLQNKKKRERRRSIRNERKTIQR